MLKEIFYRVKCITLLMFICQGFQDLASLDCNFEDGFCKWKQENADNFDWLRESGYSSYYSTGPSADHTTGDGGHYIYIDADFQNEDDKARLTSPMQEPGSYCLTFWYNMYGVNIGALNVYMKLSGGKETLILQKEKNLGNNDWRKAVINIDANDTYQIVFEGVRGDGWRGNIAIDDITMIREWCITDLVSLDCNFEDGLCNWQQGNSDDFDWLRETGDTRSYGTGPSSDHTTGDDGHYIYIEATDQYKDDKAVITSPLQESGPFCLTFWYNMYGSDIGALNVYMILNGSNKTPLLTKDKKHGNNDWRKAVVNHNAEDTYQIAFEGVRGDGIGGDIAVDDISIIPRLCSLDCDYDDGFCNWMQDNSDDFDWTLQRGPTETSDTGPEADHTSGNGQYVYIDSSKGTSGGVAWLVSPLQNAGKYCFSFWYYMYGEDVDRLVIRQLYRNGTTQEVFTRKGNQRQKWFRKQLLVHTTTNFKIVFEGGVSDRRFSRRDNGDIAIDDVHMLSCQDCENPIPNNALANSTHFGYGSVIEITCDTGYNLIGTSPIVCQTGGSWSASPPACKPFDCKHRYIPNGEFIAPNGTTFGQTASQVCNKGYTLYGDTDVTCTSIGWNGTAGTCIIVDCKHRNIPNGEFIALNGTTFGQTASQVCSKGYTLYGDTDVTCTSVGWNGTAGTCIIVDCGNPTPTHANVNSTNFKYGSVVEIKCNTGYNITGEPVMVCLANGSWSFSSPTCEPFDCGNRTLLNGQFSAPNGTTFGQTATYVCNIGYTLVGDTTISCSDSGWKGIAGTCEIKDADNDALIAVYVLVPVTVIILAVLFTIIFVRRRFPNCKKVSESKHDSRKNPVMTAANKTNTGVALESQNHINHAYEDGTLQLNDEYATITDEENVNSDNSYYNISGAAGTSKEHDAHNYDHTKETAAPFVDELYSHVSRNKNDTTCEPSYNTTLQLNSENAPFRAQEQFDMNSYDLLNNSCNETAKHRNEIEEEKESDDDHAFAGGIDPVAPDKDDYSHLNNVNIKQKCHASFGKLNDNDDKFEYSYANDNSRRTEKKTEKSLAGYEQERGLAPQYEIQDTTNDDRHYFVLEAEEVKDENRGSDNHDYFVLEKTES